MLRGIFCNFFITRSNYNIQLKRSLRFLKKISGISFLVLKNITSFVIMKWNVFLKGCCR